jgi:hypothetical protein
LLVPPFELDLFVSPPPFAGAVISGKKKNFISTLLIYIFGSNTQIPIIPSNLTVRQRQRWAPTLCLSLFSNISLILKPYLGLKRKKKNTSVMWGMKEVREHLIQFFKFSIFYSGNKAS